jgi:hypothetical protein
MLEGKLVEAGREPRNVQVVVSGRNTGPLFVWRMERVCSWRYLVSQARQRERKPPK